MSKKRADRQRQHQAIRDENFGQLRKRAQGNPGIKTRIGKEDEEKICDRDDHGGNTKFHYAKLR